MTPCFMGIKGIIQKTRRQSIRLAGLTSDFRNTVYSLIPVIIVLVEFFWILLNHILLTFVSRNEHGNCHRQLTKKKLFFVCQRKSLINLWPLFVTRFQIHPNCKISVCYM